jgi:MerR family transcriptional regulator, redox-sensitive transcriptional activator SoxR
MPEATLSIGALARLSGVSVSAIRFYEREGLLPEPERLGGQRRYTAAAARRLEVIGVAKRAGLSLAEIGVLLGSVERGAPVHRELRALASAKLPQVDAEIDRARTARDWLAIASECGCDTLEECALFSR